MKHHLKYMIYLLKHKYFVLRAGLFFRAPLWRLLIHDYSKFLPGEWLPYSRYFYLKGYGDKEEEKQAFNVAWLKHQHRNPHHWQYWVLKEDSGKLKPLPIPEKHVREMVADWTGAGKAITGKWLDVYTWYEREKNKMIIHPDTRRLVEEILDNGRGHSFFRD